MREQDQAVKWFNTEFYPPLHKGLGHSVRYDDGVLPRLRRSRIIFFTPWGPRYGWSQRGTTIVDGDREVALLRYLAELYASLADRFGSDRLSWLFLGADLYGTKINSLPPEVVVDYFASLRGWIGRLLPTAEFRLWSEFDHQAESFRRLFRGRVKAFVGPEVIDQADKVARHRGSADAQPYLVERLAEAALIELIYEPIKLSCVDSRKDSEVDLDLPRLYLVPPGLRAPWMG